MSVYVVQNEDGEVIGVASERDQIRTGLSGGLTVTEHRINAMSWVNDDDRPWVVFFAGANEDKVQAWPIAEGFPPEDRNVYKEGIEVIVYASNASKAIAQVFFTMHFDSWDFLKSDWRQLQ